MSVADVQRSKHEFVLGDQNDWVVQALHFHCDSGILSRYFLRLDAAHSARTVEVLFFHYASDSGKPPDPSVVDINTVPDEDVIYRETSIVLNPSATVAHSYDFILNDGGKDWVAEYRTGRMHFKPYVAVRPTSAAATGYKVYGVVFSREA